MTHLTWEQAVQWLKEQPDQQELVRACYYDDPLLQAAKRFAASEEWKATLRLLPQKKGKALDLGAGRGISSYALASAGWEVTAVEPDPSHLVGAGAITSLAREAGIAIEVLQSGGESLNAPDASFDLVYARQTLHHAYDLTALCREAGRVLRPGGTFIACREHVLSHKSDLPRFLESHPLHYLYGGENAFLLDEYLAAIEGAGIFIRAVFGPLESAINYFPETSVNIHRMLQSLPRKYLGHRLVDMALGPRMPWTNSVNNVLARRASRRDSTPGRLYTFVGIKPGAD